MAVESDEKLIASLLATEMAWAEAHRELNIEVLSAILADDFIKLQPDGSVLDKQGLLASYQAGDRYWEIAESTEHQVRLQDETAVLIGRWRGKGVNRGKPFNYTARFLAVYVLGNERWQMLTEHTLPPEIEPA